MSAVITPFEGTELFNTASFNDRISQINTGFSYVSNPNLLDNWYFGNPVNQRGKTEYTDSWAYSIDRWLCAGDGKVTIADGHCVFYGAVDQGLSVEMSDILGCTMTASLLLTDGTLITGTAVNTDNSIDIPFVSGVGGMYLGLNATDLSKHRRFRTYIAPERAVLAVKLELGDTQTLAHREGDRWVLNEVPDYGEQLRRCQRYCRVYKAGEYLPCIAFAMEDGWYCGAMLPYEMRAVPVNNIDSNISVTLEPILGGTGIDTILENYGTFNGVQILKFAKDGQVFKSSNYFRVKLNADFILTADL